MENNLGAVPVGRARVAIPAAQKLMLELGKPALAERLEQLAKDLSRERFTVAVVGEFSRGKSTLINRLLGRPLLPVGNMPTTAVLTHIRASNKELMLYVDEKGRKSPAMALGAQSWEGLTANNFGGPDPKGTVFMGVNDPWLGKLSLEVLDTPGAGDLEDHRARLISDALLEADGAIITISALTPMSMSEQQFIQQRLITRKTPFMMLAITKLDEIQPEQRAAMIQFIAHKLKLWKLDIPVYVAGDVEVPGGEYDKIIGLDKIRAQLQSWVTDPQRQALTDRWILAKVDDVLATAQDSLQQQAELLALDQQKREDAIQQKKQQLGKVHDAWEGLRQEMRNRGEKCWLLVADKAEDYKTSVVQRLQYEVSHNSQPANWWRQDFGYRLRIELANVASGLDGLAGRQINEDLRWLNARLEKNFKTNVTVQRDAVADKDMFEEATPQDMGLEDLDSKRSKARIATAALTIVGSVTLSCMGLGMLNILCTSGVGTGSALLTDKFFKAKVDKQRQVVAQAIAIQVPKTMDEAMIQTQRRLNMVYGDIIQAASDRENLWMEAQNHALANASKPQDPEALEQLPSQLERLEALRSSVQEP